MSAASRARRIDPNLEIIVLEKGAVVSYGACGLPYFIEGKVRRPEDLVVHTPEFFRKERNISVRTGAAAAGISHAKREVVLETGERIRYDRLVIATGARPDGGALGGVDQPHVFPLNTYADGVRLKTYLSERSPRKAVVIGGSFIGLEAADALRRNGLSVKLIERSPYLLRREDEALTLALCAHMRRFGVEVELGTQVRTIGPGAVDDTPCDLALLATGLRPNAEIATEGGIDLGRTGAIRVNDRLETNLGGIFAAGDCAETMNLVMDRPDYIPLGTTANKMGRVAGANAAGGRERFAGVVGTCVVSVFGLGAAMTGLTEAQARREGFDPVSARIEAPSRAAYFSGKPSAVELIADRATARLLGGVITGEQDVAGRINVIATALYNRMTVDAFERLDLAYAPPFSVVWDPLLIAAQQLLRRL
jgi:NADPH-dependent 2,4-dienoyl-CoA reductase/sulfur reductase-like enzyme